ncbi:MAG: hypothetical protein ACO1OB_10490 [Archangium sp.]
MRRAVPAGIDLDAEISTRRQMVLLASPTWCAALHPDGLKSSLVNWTEVVAFTLQRLERVCARHPNDEARATLLREVTKYFGVSKVEFATPDEAPASVLHLRRRRRNGGCGSRRHPEPSPARGRRDFVTFSA